MWQITQEMMLNGKQAIECIIPRVNVGNDLKTYKPASPMCKIE